MTTDVDVQFFSHLNGLVLGNNWGDMIRLLDTCLVNGLPLTEVLTASVNEQGDITLNLFADHKCLLFQIIELSGFEPAEINGKYRIKGTPTSKQLILKATHAGKSITKKGTAKLSALGYDIVFRDTNDVKRVYRAKNPRAEHPFIRIDESAGDGANVYSATFAKSAMVGLLEDMTHIDDYQNTSKLQLPLDINDFSKNWKVTGSGYDCVRGWAKWTWAQGTAYALNESETPYGSGRNFTLVGSADLFYLLNQTDTSYPKVKMIYGCGLFDSAMNSDVIPNWFLFAVSKNTSVSNTLYPSDGQYSALINSDPTSRFFACKYNMTAKVSNNTQAKPITPGQYSGYEEFYTNSALPALSVPFSDVDGYLRGTLNLICYAGKRITVDKTTPLLSDNSMYVSESCMYGQNNENCGFYFYLGEIE